MLMIQPSPTVLPRLTVANAGATVLTGTLAITGITTAAVVNAIGVNANRSLNSAVWGATTRSPGVMVYDNGTSRYGMFLGHDNANFGTSVVSGSGIVFVGYSASSDDFMNQVQYGLKLVGGVPNPGLYFAAAELLGTPPTWDTYLLRTGVGILTIGGTLILTGSYLYLRNAGAAVYFGAGDDNGLLRLGPRSMNANFTLGLTVGAAGTTALHMNVDGDAADRCFIRGDGLITWGDGANTQDTFQYRASANELAFGSIAGARLYVYGEPASAYVQLKSYSAALALAPFYLDASAIHLRYVSTDRITIDATGLSFFGATPIARPTVTGSRGANAALASLLTALANLGLVVDSSS